MALVATLLELRTQVRQQADIENDDHVTDTELDGWINKGIRVFHGQLQRTDPDMFIVTTSLTATAGTKEYDFSDGSAFSPAASNFRSLRGIDYLEGDQTYLLRSYTWEERNRRDNLVAGRIGTFPRYRVARNGTDGSGARLTFDIDPSNRTYTVHYLPSPDTLAIDADEVDGVMGWDDYVIAYAAKRARLKSDELEQAQFCEAEMQRVMADIKLLGTDRHSDNQERIARTRRRVRSDYYDEYEY